MIFTIVFLLFVILVLVYEIKVERKVKREQEGTVVAKWSYPMMAGSYLILLLATTIEYFLIKREINFIITLSGLIIFISGLLLRNWAIHTLGEYFSRHVEIKTQHKLIKEGPYRYVRHPNYLATILKGVGFTLIPNSFYILLYVLLIFIPIRIVRIYLEEKELVKEFGQDYLDYKKGVYALLPFKRIRRKINGS